MNITLMLIFMAASNQNHLPPGLLESVCIIESNLNPTAIHHHDGNGDSLGICQIKYNTAKSLGFKGTEKDLMDPKTNIQYAAKYLAHQIHRYHGNIQKGLIAYNQGSAKDLTRSKYSDKVIKVYQRRLIACQDYTM